MKFCARGRTLNKHSVDSALRGKACHGENFFAANTLDPDFYSIELRLTLF
jgi:hypothetical protein